MLDDVVLGEATEGETASKVPAISPKRPLSSVHLLGLELVRSSSQRV